MSARIMNRVIEARLRSYTDKLVLLVLASYADDGGAGVYPSTNRIAGDCSLTPRGVRNAIDRLRENGLLIREKDGGKGPRSTNVHRIDLDVLDTYATRDNCPSPSTSKSGSAFPFVDGKQRNVVPLRGNPATDKEEPRFPDSSLNRQETWTTETTKPTSDQNVFTNCRQYLETSGIPPATARKMLGKWKSDLGDDSDALVGIIERAKSRSIVDPLPWITACIVDRNLIRTKDKTAPSRRVPDRMF